MLNPDSLTQTGTKTGVVIAEDGCPTDILEDSKEFAGVLASCLRERIYDEVIARLFEGLAEARGLKDPTPKQLVLNSSTFTAVGNCDNRSNNATH